MDLSVVVCTWRRSADMLLHSVHTLSDQTDPPREIIVVDTNTEAAFIQENYNALLPYPLVRLICRPRMPFNLAKGMNVGIKAARGQYVIATCMEMLFSPNVVEVLASKVQPGCWIESACAVLSKNTPIGSIETVHSRWAELCAAADAYSAPHRPATGALMVAEREWWHSICGYDEVRYPYENPDVDNARQAALSELHTMYLGWPECQLIHQEHSPLKDGYEQGGEWYASVTLEQIRGRPRNPNGWGEG